MRDWDEIEQTVICVVRTVCVGLIGLVVGLVLLFVAVDRCAAIIRTIDQNWGTKG